MWFWPNSNLFLIFSLSLVHSEDDLFMWINNLKTFRDHDQLKSKEMHDLMGHMEETMTEKYDDNKEEASRWIRDYFYKLYAQPQKNNCMIAKTLGGVWMNNLGVPDGTKLICFDKVFKDIKANECLVYSFGLSDDWSFEEQMFQMGCKIRAFDPTVEDTKGLHDGDGFKFAQIGIAEKTIVTQVDCLEENKQFMTLSDTMKYMGDENKNITILKVDIEAMEFRCINNWVDSGMLDRIDQIHMEVHNSKKWEKEQGEIIIPFRMVDFLAYIYDKYNFRLIGYSPNLWVEKSLDSEEKYYSIFDVTLKKIEHK